MALLTKVGSFQKRTTVGQQVVTGVGFQPKALIVWGYGPAAEATVDNALGMALTLGMAGEDPTQNLATGFRAAHGVATSDTGRGDDFGIAVMPNSAGSAFEWRGTLLSYDADGFTIDWTINAGGNGYLNYLALGGDELRAATKVWYSPTSAEGVSLQSVTGIGFQPDLVFHSNGLQTNAAFPRLAVDAHLAFGFANRAGQQWGITTMAQDAVNPTFTYRWQRNDLVIVNSSETVSPYIFHGARHVGMTLDGFNVRWVYPSGSTAGRRMFTLALQGVSSYIGRRKKVGAAAPATQDLVTGFRPRALLMASVLGTVSQAPVNSGSMQLGATDGVSQALLAATSVNAVTPSNERVARWTNRIHGAGWGAVDALPTQIARFDRFLNNGARIVWDPNTASNPEIGFLALTDPREFSYGPGVIRAGAY